MGASRAKRIARWLAFLPSTVTPPSSLPLSSSDAGFPLSAPPSPPCARSRSVPHLAAVGSAVSRSLSRLQAASLTPASIRSVVRKSGTQAGEYSTIGAAIKAAGSGTSSSASLSHPSSRPLAPPLNFAPPSGSLTIFVYPGEYKEQGKSTHFSAAAPPAELRALVHSRRRPSRQVQAHGLHGRHQGLH